LPKRRRRLQLGHLQSSIAVLAMMDLANGASTAILWAQRELSAINGLI